MGEGSLTIVVSCGHEKRYSSGNVSEVGVRYSRSASKGVYFRMLRMYINGMDSFLDAARVVSGVTNSYPLISFCRSECYTFTKKCPFGSDAQKPAPFAVYTKTLPLSHLSTISEKARWSSNYFTSSRYTNSSVEIPKFC